MKLEKKNGSNHLSIQGHVSKKIVVKKAIRLGFLSFVEVNFVTYAVEYEATNFFWIILFFSNLQIGPMSSANGIVLDLRTWALFFRRGSQKMGLTSSHISKRKSFRPIRVPFSVLANKLRTIEVTLHVQFSKLKKKFMFILF